jgi:hypothetical protein
MMWKGAVDTTPGTNPILSAGSEEGKEKPVSVNGSTTET